MSNTDHLQAWAWWGSKVREVIHRSRLARGQVFVYSPRRAIGQAAVDPHRPSKAINSAGWVREDVIATAALKQRLHGRSKLVPGEFVLTATESQVVAFKARGRRNYTIRLLPGQKGSWHRGSVRISDLEEGRESERATLEIGGERIAVKRFYDADIATDELFELLGR